MKLLFSTPLAVYTFDCETRALARVRSAGPPELYGISAGPDGAVFSNSCIDNSTLNDHQAYLRACQARLSFIPGNGAAWKGGLLQPHQIECHDGHILCANSGHNCITVFGPSGSVVHHYPTRVRYDILPDGRKANHFNSVHVRDGVVHVVAHNYQHLSAVWLFAWPDFELINVIPTNTQCAHNIMRDGDDLLICNSKAGALYSVLDKRDVWVVQGGGFITRGLAATGDCLFVGLTAFASRGDRKNCDSALCVLDRFTKQLLHRYDFTGIGAIHEVRLMDRTDDCHGGAVISSAWFSAD